MERDALNIEYFFNFADGAQHSFAVCMKGPRLALEPPFRDPPPDWTVLEFCQCSHCPLSPQEHQCCPIAANLVDVIDLFKSIISYEEADVTVRTDNRDYFRKVPVATGVSSLIGVIMVSSGCPILTKLRPMVFTHLPFADTDETMYRSISMYLLAQYFRWKWGETPDWDLVNLINIYDDINVVNEHFSLRLKAVCEKDASLNALIKLDCFASIAATSIEYGGLEGLEGLFEAFK